MIGSEQGAGSKDQGAVNEGKRLARPEPWQKRGDTAWKLKKDLSV